MVKKKKKKKKKKKRFRIFVLLKSEEIPLFIDNKG